MNQLDTRRELESINFEHECYLSLTQLYFLLTLFVYYVSSIAACIRFLDSRNMTTSGTACKWSLLRVSSTARFLCSFWLCPPSRMTQIFSVMYVIALFIMLSRFERNRASRSRSLQKQGSKSMVLEPIGVLFILLILSTLHVSTYSSAIPTSF